MAMGNKNTQVRSFELDGASKFDVVYCLCWK